MGNFDYKTKGRNKPLKRKAGIRKEKEIKEDLPKVVFSLKDFDYQQIPPGQSYATWESEKILSRLAEKLQYISQCNIVEAQQQGYIKIYGQFPPRSLYKHPQHIAQDVKWAVIKNINGQKGRVAGHVIDNVFYIVFLDAEHKFWVTDP